MCVIKKKSTVPGVNIIVCFHTGNVISPSKVVAFIFSDWGQFFLNFALDEYATDQKPHCCHVTLNTADRSVLSNKTNEPNALCAQLELFTGKPDFMQMIHVKTKYPVTSDIWPTAAPAHSGSLGCLKVLLHLAPFSLQPESLSVSSTESNSGFGQVLLSFPKLDTLNSRPGACRNAKTTKLNVQFTMSATGVFLIKAIKTAKALFYDTEDLGSSNRSSLMWELLPSLLQTNEQPFSVLWFLLI